MGNVTVANPFGWRTDRWFSNVLQKESNAVWEPVGPEPKDFTKHQTTKTPMNNEYEYEYEDRREAEAIRMGEKETPSAEVVGVNDKCWNSCSFYTYYIYIYIYMCVSLCFLYM